MDKEATTESSQAQNHTQVQSVAWATTILEEQMTKLGAFWKKESKDGKPYWTGSIEWKGDKIPLVCFKNGFKKTDKHPDIIINLQEPREPRADRLPEESQEEMPF